MIQSYIPLILFLSEHGNSLYIKVNGENFRDVEASDSIHPRLRRLPLQKDNRDTLFFLQMLLADKELPMNQSLKTYHIKTTYRGHTGDDFKTDEGNAHECSLSSMITFIFRKIDEENAANKPAKL